MSRRNQTNNLIHNERTGARHHSTDVFQLPEKVTDSEHVIFPEYILTSNDNDTTSESIYQYKMKIIDDSAKALANDNSLWCGNVGGSQSLVPRLAATAAASMPVALPAKERTTASMSVALPSGGGQSAGGNRKSKKKSKKKSRSHKSGSEHGNYGSKKNDISKQRASDASKKTGDNEILKQQYTLTSNDTHHEWECNHCHWKKKFKLDSAHGKRFSKGFDPGWARKHSTGKGNNTSAVCVRTPKALKATIIAAAASKNK